MIRLCRRLFTDRYGINGWGMAVILVALITVVTTVAVGGMYTADRHTCDRKATAMGREWRYGLFEGCLVRTTTGQWVPLDIYRQVNR